MITLKVPSKYLVIHVLKEKLKKTLVKIEIIVWER